MSKYIDAEGLNNLIDALCEYDEEDIMLDVDQTAIEDGDQIGDIMDIIRAVENNTDFCGEAIMHRCSNPECGRTHIHLHFFIPEEVE